jgi:sulfate permease, SulP family
MKKKELTPELFSLLAEGLPPGRLSVEVTAGVIVGIVALPLALAFAIASGSVRSRELSPQYSRVS